MYGTQTMQMTITVMFLSLGAFYVNYYEPRTWWTSTIRLTCWAQPQWDASARPGNLLSNGERGVTSLYLLHLHSRWNFERLVCCGLTGQPEYLCASPSLLLTALHHRLSDCGTHELTRHDRALVALVMTS